MKKFLFIFIIILSVITIKAPSVFAASISFETLPSVNTGETLDVTVNADIDGILINSVELVIDYDENLFSFIGYSDNDALVKLWIDPPRATEGKIYLSGIIPGGVLGLYDAKKEGLSAIPLVHLLFVAKKEGNTGFSFISSKILKHDGEGTPLSHDQKTAEVSIKNNPNVNLQKEGQENLKENTKNNLSDLPKSFNPTLWIILSLIISGIIGYKLLKYKDDEV